MTPVPALNLVEVDLAALRHNYRLLRRLLPPEVGIMAVVKADAYGHGLAPAAGAFAAAGADCFGVATATEGVALRDAGLDGEIVVLLGLEPEAVAAAVARELSPVVFDDALPAALSRRAVADGREVGVHLKVDLGMGRFGLEPAAAVKLAATIGKLPGLRLTGLLSHFPLADSEPAAATCRQQWRQLATLGEEVAAASGCRPRLHMANSAGLLRFAEARGQMVRPGLSLYGYTPLDFAVSGLDTAGLRPAMALKSRIMQIKELPAGSGVSYGHRFVTSRATRLAVLPLGYADGYPRGVSGRAQVLIGGRRVPVRGTICMNACMAEIDTVPAARVGDEVVFMGRQGEEFIGADEIADWHRTIPYEILCRLGGANERRYHDS
ncbi:MAG: alanine racemase [Desulfurivibrio sp.]|nr:alanine racemase [Desulfurivibrio sp.]